MGNRKKKQSGTGGKSEKGKALKQELITRHASRVTEI
jgi:hypothetical protein